MSSDKETITGRRRNGRHAPTAEELQALDVESSKIIDLETFVSHAEVDPIYFSTPYYVYPDGRIVDETFGVIGAAMRETDRVGIGRVTLSRRERLVVVEPRDRSGTDHTAGGRGG